MKRVIAVIYILFFVFILSFADFVYRYYMPKDYIFWEIGGRRQEISEISTVILNQKEWLEIKKEGYSEITLYKDFDLSKFENPNVDVEIEMKAIVTGLKGKSWKFVLAGVKFVIFDEKESLLGQIAYAWSESDIPFERNQWLKRLDKDQKILKVSFNVKELIGNEKYGKKQKLRVLFWTYCSSKEEKLLAKLYIRNVKVNIKEEKVSAKIKKEIKEVVLNVEDVFTQPSTAFDVHVSINKTVSLKSFDLKILYNPLILKFKEYEMKMDDQKNIKIISLRKKGEIDFVVASKEKFNLNQKDFLKLTFHATDLALLSDVNIKLDLFGDNYKKTVDKKVKVYIYPKMLGDFDNNNTVDSTDLSTFENFLKKGKYSIVFDIAPATKISKEYFDMAIPDGKIDSQDLYVLLSNLKEESYEATQLKEKKEEKKIEKVYEKRYLRNVYFINDQRKLVAVTVDASSNEIPQGEVYGLWIVKNKIFVPARMFGIRIYDVSNPDNPKEFSEYPLENMFVTKLLYKNNWIIAVDILREIAIVNFSDLKKPKLLGRLETKNYIYDIDFNGKYLYLAQGLNGVKIIDLSNPAVPIEYGEYSTKDYAIFVKVIGDNMYIAGINNKIQVVDKKDPLNLKKIDEIIIKNKVSKIKVYNEKLFVLDSQKNLYIYEVKATKPKLVKEIRLLLNAKDFYIFDNIAYILTDKNKIEIVEIND